MEFRLAAHSAKTRGEPEPGWAHSDNPHFFCPRCRNGLFLRIASVNGANGTCCGEAREATIAEA